jgi:hypothetical protein
MPEPSTTEGRHIQGELKNLLEDAAVRRAESSASRRQGYPPEHRAVTSRFMREASVHTGRTRDTVPAAPGRLDNEHHSRDRRAHLDERVRRGYHPRRGGRYDSGKDRSPSPEPPGLQAFSRAIRRVPFPTWFRAPTTITKYSGETRAELWLADYRLACQLGGTDDDNLIIRNLPMFLSDAARAWLEHLPPAQISNRDDLVKAFAGNFQGTYVRPGNSWDLRSCRQQPGESLRDYIWRFSKQRTELPNITDSDVNDAFLAGTTCRDLVSKMGRKTPTRASKLMDIATKFASGQEVVEAIFRKDKQPQGRQPNDVPEAFDQRGARKKGKKKSQAKRDAADADLVAAAEHKNPRKPPGGANLFNKMLKESCPYHQGPVKHTLEECVMLRRYLHKAGPPTEGGRAPDNDKKEAHKAEEFPEVHDCFMIYSGRVANASARHRKQERREVCLVKVAAPVYVDWSNKPITFDQGDHPDRGPSPEAAASTSSTPTPSGSCRSICPRSGPVRRPFTGSFPGSASSPLDNSICPSALGLPPTSERKPSHSRWSSSEEPTTQCWGDHATPSSWSSPTTPTSSSRCWAPMGSSPSAPCTDMRTNATWSAWSTPRPSPNPRPSSPMWRASPRRHNMRSATPATSNQQRRLSPSLSTLATTPPSRSGSAPSSTLNRKQCSSTFSARTPRFLRGAPRTCLAYRGKSPSTHWISELEPDP